jgi:hypothetical protein
VTGEDIAWVVHRRYATETGRQASNLNFAIVVAADPQAARERAEKENRFGEKYDAHGYAVVSLQAFLQHVGGVVLLRGDMTDLPQYPAEAATWIF